MQAVAIMTEEPGWHGKALKRELNSLGFAAQFVSLSDCSIVIDDVSATVQVPGFSHLPAGIFVRGIAGGSLEQVITRLNVLHTLEHIGVPVFNSGRAIERTVDKGLTSFLLRHHGVPTPRTWVVQNLVQAQEVARREFAERRELVLKPLFGSQGNGVERLAVLADLERYTPLSGIYYLQEYLDKNEAEYRDWRVFVINGRAIAAMQRRSAHWVTNRAQGAVCEPIGPDRQLYEIAEAAAAAVAVDYAGVDLLRDRNGHWTVGEVNGIPAWQGLQRTTDKAITTALVHAFTDKIKAARRLAVAG